jgi:hypothetical protein
MPQKDSTAKNTPQNTPPHFPKRKLKGFDNRIRMRQELLIRYTQRARDPHYKPTEQAWYRRRCQEIRQEIAGLKQQARQLLAEYRKAFKKKPPTALKPDF